ncbi:MULTISPECIES: MFS transporter [Amycolatopsis]|uniref:Major Facilitator Superfamily protein n=2 Tax=Amycolatopsis TaxID=1813 RepID=A0A1I3JKE5_9PSEU|nr:Major Facilitator Superfamily protein [Amycolatopsis sacchari]
MLAALVAGVVLLAVFAVIERRAAAPLIPSAVFARRNVRIGNALTVCIGAVVTTPLFFLSLYFQQVLGETALRAGLSLLPMLAVISLGVLVSQRLIPALGPRPLVVGGALVAAAGLWWLSGLPAHPAYVTHVLAPTLVVGAGTSLTMMPGIVAATTGVDPRHAGVASGLLNMCRQLGGALGIAALVTLASTVTGPGAANDPAAVVHGYRAALLALAALSVATAVIALFLEGNRSARR